MNSLRRIINLKNDETLLSENIIKFSSNEKPRLIAGKCEKCGDISFPAKERCGKCESKNIKETLLSNRAKIYSYTIVRRAFPGYELPNIVAVVKVKEDDSLMIITQIKECTPEEIRVGMEVESILAELYKTSDGRKIIGYAFRPVDGGK